MPFLAGIITLYMLGAIVYNLATGNLPWAVIWAIGLVVEVVIISIVGGGSRKT